MRFRPCPESTIETRECGMTALRAAGGTSKRPGTAQRRAISDAMASCDKFRTAQEVHAELRTAGESVGLTTVYRHLQQLAVSGELHVLQLSDGQTAYRLCGKDEHDHLVCTECGLAVEIAGAGLDEWSEAEARKHGFSRVTHVLEILGLCPECARDVTGRSEQATTDRIGDL